MADTRSLFVELRAGESAVLDGGRITVTLESKTGKVAQLRITAPQDVPIKHPGQAATSGAAQARQGINLKT